MKRTKSKKNVTVIDMSSRCSMIVSDATENKIIPYRVVYYKPEKKKSEPLEQMRDEAILGNIMRRRAYQIIFDELIKRIEKRERTQKQTGGRITYNKG